jgi:hypothetical protein
MELFAAYFRIQSLCLFETIKQFTQYFSSKVISLICTQQVSECDLSQCAEWPDY